MGCDPINSWFESSLSPNMSAFNETLGGRSACKADAYVLRGSIPHAGTTIKTESEMIMDRRTQGDHAEALAISFLIRDGYTVSVPFSENQPYDLVAEKNGEFFAVQVKSTSCLVKNAYQVELRSSGWNSDGRNVKNFDSGGSDYLFVWTPESCYFMPSDVTPKKFMRVRPDGKYGQYEVMGE